MTELIKYRKEDQDKLDESYFLWTIAADLSNYARFQGISVADALDILETELVGMHEEHFKEVDRTRFIGVYQTTQAPRTHQRRITIPANIARGQTVFYAYRTAAGGVRFEPADEPQQDTGGDLNG